MATYLDNFSHSIKGPETGEKLVFLHGVMGFAANWRRIARAFEEEFQVLVYDQRGHGRSFQPESGYGPEDYAGDLLKILDELGWREINLVGHSMGGRAAYHFGSRWPERVTRLVIEDIGPNMHVTRSSLVVSFLDKVPVPFQSKREAKEWFDTEFMRLYAAEPRRAELAAYLYANLIENEAREAVWRFSAQGIRESVEQGRKIERWDEIRSLSMPTLVIRGSESQDFPIEVYQRMLQENSHLIGVEIPDSGHWVHSDQPDLFISVLDQFLHDRPISLAGP